MLIPNLKRAPTVCRKNDDDDDDDDNDDDDVSDDDVASLSKTLISDE